MHQNTAGGLSRIRDGYHVRELNLQRYIDVQKSILPELYPSSSSDAAQAAVVEHTTPPQSGNYHSNSVLSRRPAFNKARMNEIAPDHADWVITRRKTSRLRPTEKALNKALESDSVVLKPQRPSASRSTTTATHSESKASKQRQRAIKHILLHALQQPEGTEHEEKMPAEKNQQPQQRAKCLRDKINRMKLNPNRVEIVEEKAKIMHRRATALYTTNQIRENRIAISGPKAIESIKRREIQQIMRQKERRQTALLRKQEIDKRIKLKTENSIDRWASRRLEREELERRHNYLKSWMKVVYLAQSGLFWENLSAAFQNNRALRNREGSAMTIQKQWRVRRNSFEVAVTPIMIMKRFIKIARKRHRQRQVRVIVHFLRALAGFKFKRAVYKCVHRVSICQSIWKGYNSVTSARMKALLLLWKRVEKKRGDSIMAQVDCEQDESTKRVNTILSEASPPKEQPPTNTSGLWKKAMMKSKITSSKNFQTLEEKLILHLKAVMEKSGVKKPSSAIKHRLLRRFLTQRRQAFRETYERHKEEVQAWRKSNATASGPGGGSRRRRRRAAQRPIAPHFTLYSCQSTVAEMEALIVQGYREARNML